MAYTLTRYSGLVSSVTYEEPTKGFYILKMVLDSIPPPVFRSNLITVRGSIPVLKINNGSWLTFEGKVVEHPQHGWQIEITKAPLLPEWDLANIQSFLASNGVSRLHLTTCVQAFGEDFLQVLDAEDTAKLEGAGLSAYIAKHMLATWKTSRSYLTSIDLLIQLGVPKTAISQIWEIFKDRTRDILATNPWLLTQADGITFAQADLIAEQLRLDVKSPERLDGAILFCLRAFRGSGDVYVDRQLLMQAVGSLVDKTAYSFYTEQDFQESLIRLRATNLLILDGQDAIYEPWLYEAEFQSAQFLGDRLETARWDSVEQRKQFLTALASIDSKVEALADLGTEEATIRAAIASVSSMTGLTLTATQAEGVYNALTSPVSIITGLPGTGKTSLLKTLVKILQAAKITMLLVAPTGIAAKRLSSVTGVSAKTVHRAFGAKGSAEDEQTSTYAGVTKTSTATVGQDTSDWEYGPGKPHPAQYVLIDEVSMVDQSILHRILTSTSEQCRLVFVGDAAQLPSVGPGNVLRELISSQVFPVVALKDIFRQEEASDIVLAAHQIHRGEMPEVTREGDFIFFPLYDEDKVLSMLRALAAKAHSKNLNYQILSPRHAGLVGVTNLNTVLREQLNPKRPGVPEVKLGFGDIRVSDRVLFVKNDYDLNVFNGDLGTIVRIDNRAKEIEIELMGTPVLRILVPFKKATQLLRLAYASTVHKCVHPDTLVETNFGLVPIGSLSETGVTATPGGPKAYQNIVRNPADTALTVVTQEGYSLTCTRDHRILVWGSSGYVEKQAQNIVNGDIVCLKLGCSIGDLSLVPLDPLPSGHPIAIQHTTPSQVTEEFASFLGLFVADGTLFKGGFRLAKRHKDVADHFDSVCQNLFGLKPKRFITNGAYHVEVHSTLLSSWLTSLGGLSPNAKGIPPCVLRSRLSIQRYFLQGLFEDGSAHLRSEKGLPFLDHIELRQTNLQILTIVQVMLLRFGIVCAVSHSRKSLYIYGSFAKVFAKEIGFLAKFKQDRLQYPCGKDTHYIVPVLREDAPSGLQGQNARYRGYVSRETFASWHPTSPLLTWHHSKVTGVTETYCSTVCYEVPDGHQFLQNGFGGSNCQGQEWEHIIVPILSTFSNQLQRNLFYTAITRAKKKVFLVGDPASLEAAILNNKEDVRHTKLAERLQNRVQKSATA